MEVNGDVRLSVKSIVEKRGVDLKEKKHRLHLTHMAPILWFMRFLWFFNVDCGKGISLNASGRCKLTLFDTNRLNDWQS